MSKDWVKDIHDMHTHYEARDWVGQKLSDGDKAVVRKLLDFRLNFLGEELLEARKNLTVDNSEEVVDAMIDLCVVAIGTLDLFGVDSHKAWDEVLKANMAKKVGVKPGRPNPLGLPDLTKPSGWRAPSHKDNVGILADVLEDPRIE
jgi:hypothetical protein